MDSQALTNRPRSNINENLKRSAYITDFSLETAKNILIQACVDTPNEKFLKIGAVVLLRAVVQKMHIKPKIICALAGLKIEDWLEFMNSKFARHVAKVIEKLVKLEHELDLPDLFKRVHAGRAASTEVVLKYLGKLKDANNQPNRPIKWVFNYNASTDKALTAKQVIDIQKSKVE